MTRKVIILLLALMLCLPNMSVLAAVTEPGTFPFTVEPAELTIWAGNFAGQQDYDVAAMTKWYEKQTGVHINWIQVSSSEIATLFNTSIASGAGSDTSVKIVASSPEALAFLESAEGRTAFMEKRKPVFRGK